MKNKNKLVALILTVLMLGAPAAAYAETYASDTISMSTSTPAMEEQTAANATPAPEAGGEIAPVEATVEEQSTETAPAPAVGEAAALAEEAAEEQPEAEATPLPEIGETPVPTEQILEEQPVNEAPEAEPIVATASENGIIDIRAAASGDAEIIGRLNRNDPVIVLGVEGDWTKILAGSLTGYVFSANLPASAPEATLAPEEMPNGSEAQVQIDAEDNLIPDENGEPIPADAQAAPEATRSDLRQAVIKTWMDAGADTKYGDSVTIFHEIQNFTGWSYTLQWQRKGADGWSDVPGATGETYTFTLTEENLNTEWRIRVDVAVPEASEDAAP